MYLRKLKPSRGLGRFWIPLITLLFFFLFVALMSIKVAIILVLFVFVIMSQYSLYAYYRTRNITYLFSGLFTFSYSGFLLFVPQVGVLAENKFVAFTFFFISIALGLAAFSQVLIGKYKWRGRDLFELIARNITEAGNGFTSRPHPTGTYNYTREEILAFVKYLQANLIGLAIIDDQKIYLVPVKAGYEYSMIMKSGYRLLESSWIVFQNDGQVSVHISKADYLDYNEALSFNLLCDSLGETFIEFLELFNKGEEIRIIDKLNSIKIGILS